MVDMKKDDNVSLKREITIVTLFFGSIVLILVLMVVFARTKKISPLPNIIKAEFSLTDQNNKEFTSHDLKDKVSLIYFGTTHCPDICTSALNKIVEIISTLEERNEKRRVSINTIFITLDPEKDSHKILKDFLNNFHPSIIGLRGEEDKLSKVVADFKISYKKVPNPGNLSDYALAHSSFIYIFDKNVKCVQYFSVQDETKSISDYIIRVFHNSHE